jgi:hypothetical protein
MFGGKDGVEDEGCIKIRKKWKKSAFRTLGSFLIQNRKALFKKEKTHGHEVKGRCKRYILFWFHAAVLDIRSVCTRSWYRFLDSHSTFLWFGWFVF